MANLKEIRSRISSVSSTMKITSAMKMVSAAKLKKAQDKLQSIEPFSKALKESISNLLPSVNKNDITLLSNNTNNNKVLIISISSNRGLCGGFNANIFKKIQPNLGEKTEIYSIGKKAGDQFIRNNNFIYDKNHAILDDVTASKSKEISTKIINEFIAGRWSEVYIAFNKFKNAGTQITTYEKLLPVCLDDDTKDSNTPKDYIFEPNKSNIINTLIPQQIHTQLFASILSSVASEHGARMTAMHKATDNAEELKQGLTLSYNRQRPVSYTHLRAHET